MLPVVGALAAAIIGGLLIVLVARRRRDRDEPELATATLGPSDGQGPEAVQHGSGATRVEPAEADIPRWRRPSVNAARASAPAVVVTSARSMLQFTAPPEPEVGRWVVRYALVSLLTEPDEVFGRRVADLDAGDEVEDIGHRGAWLQVRTPRGDVGWLEMMTVEPYVDGHRPETAPMAAEPVREAPGEPAPEESQLDSLLAAIVAERARVAEAEAAAAAAAAAASLSTVAPVTPDDATDRSRPKRRKPSTSTRKRALPDPG
jgi:hypothetical protein